MGYEPQVVSTTISSKSVTILRLEGVSIAPNGVESFTLDSRGVTGANIAGATMTGHLLFTDATYDIGASGATRPRSLYTSSNITVGGDCITGRLRFNSQGTIRTSGSDGVICLFNNAESGFTRLDFGGTTSSFPALTRNSAGLEAKLADDSAFTTLKAASLTVSDGTQLVISSAAFTNGAGAQTGTLTNAPAAGNPTKWIPVNDNGTTRYIPAW
jgi:hypothetical protein